MTSPDLWPRIEQLYHSALALEERERATFLRKTCDGNEPLLREVESLLVYATDAQTFMAAPALDMMAPALEPEPVTFVGRRLGQFEIEARIGSGGMGEVYRARDTKLGRSVAVKILPSAFSADADRCARFEREARVLASLSHPHIGAIYGVEHSGGLHGLVLELVEGQTLEEVLEEGPLPMSRALAIARQIADALEAAHEKGIVHRDLKPENIAITSAGVVKVFDFGLAKAVADEAVANLSELPTRTIGATHDGTILGTAAYMSPEQARGKTVDRRTDIWAFGCVLLEMLTGHKIFAAETVPDTIAGILHRNPDWTAIPDTTPQGIRRLLQRCLEKDTKRRLHHIADARIEIDDALGEPVLSEVERRPIAGLRLALTTTQHPLILAAAAVVFGAVGATGVLMSWPISPASSGSLVRLSIAVPPTQVLEQGRFQPIALSPDGSILVYTAITDGRTSLFVRSLDELTARPLPAAQGGSTPFFSPDGRWLAFFADGFLKKVRVTGGGPLTICEASPVWSASWGEDDRIVFATTVPSSGLWLVPASGGEPIQITTPNENEAQHGYPQLLPGGRQVLFSIRRDNAWQLALLTLESRDRRLLANGRTIGEGARFLPTGHVVYAQDGGLVAAPFNPATGDLDQAVPLLERVGTSRFGGASFAVAGLAGTLVYLPAGTTVTDRTLLRVDRDGRTAPLIESRAGYESLSLSPDGRQVAVTIASETGSDLWMIDLQRATRVRFTAGGTSAFPVWAADGSSVAFQSTAPGPWNLFARRITEGTPPQPLLTVSGQSTAVSWPSSGASLLPGTLPTLSGSGPQFPGSWAADGSTLAFHERKPNGERDIWTVSPGHEPLPFLLTTFDEHSPRFSPDGKWLAYVSDESGRDDVYVQPFPGPGPKWLVSTDGGTDPVWSRNGRELFYRSGDQMIAVLVAATGEFSAGRPRRLFEIRFEDSGHGANYDVSADGSWFVMARSHGGPAAQELQVVLNWFNEVNARTDSDRSPSLGSDSQQRGGPGEARPLTSNRCARAVVFAVLACVMTVFDRSVVRGGARAFAQTAASETTVRETLQRYSAALESLDADAVKKVHPAIPADSLAKAFQHMRELKVVIDGVRVLSIDSSSARVSCRVTQTLTPKIGARQTTAVTRVVRLRRDNEMWLIEGFER